MNNRFGKNDLFFLVSLLLISIILFGFFAFFKKDGTKVVVEIDGVVFGTYDLNEDRTVEIVNSEKKITNILVIKDKKADVIEADCPDLLCVHQKSISNENESIVCLPNKVVIYIPSRGQDALDGIAQ